MKILVVDDHPMIREGLRQTLATARFDSTIMEAQNAVEAIQHLRSESFDIVILDINLPDRSGLDVVKDLRIFNAKVPVLILSMHPEETLAVRAIRLGANGYLSKSTTPSTLIQVVEKIARGGQHFSAETICQLVSYVQDIGVSPLHDSLSDREYQVMCRLASGQSIIMIAQELNVSANTISTYRSRILEKLNMKTNSDLTRYALEFKLIE